MVGYGVVLILVSLKSAALMFVNHSLVYLVCILLHKSFPDASFAMLKGQLGFFLTVFICYKLSVAKFTGFNKLLTSSK